MHTCCPLCSTYSSLCSPQVFAPFKSLLPIVEPNDIVLGGWDISGLNMAEAMERASVSSGLAAAISRSIHQLARRQQAAVWRSAAAGSSL